MKLYNSLTRDFQSLKKKTLKIYVCGPTVYNYIHLGNARPNLLIDTLIRYWDFQGVKVDYLQNITDIDDKIIAQALKDKTTEVKIANFYTKAFLEDLRSLNVKTPTKIERISDHIEEMISFIEQLVKADFAYLVAGDVYFAIDKWKKKYGELSGKKIADLIQGQRVDTDTKKQNPLDFALWKKTKVGKTWPSPFGDGRPGWHTECVTLIKNYFHNQTIDLHAGGIDLKFPHHENERIQYWASSHQELANLWLHNGHLNFEDQKMSKSFGNVFFVKDFVKKYSPNLLRWIFLTTNYKQPLNLTVDLLQQGLKFFEKIENLRKKLLLAQFWNDSAEKFQNLDLISPFQKAMDDDLNTAEVLSILEQGMKVLNQAVDQKIKFENLKKTVQEMVKIFEILGFFPLLNLELSPGEVKLFHQWQKFLQTKDYQAADKIRQELQKKGLV